YFAVFVFQLPLKALVFIANAGAPRFLIEMLRNLCSMIGFQAIFSAGDFVHSLLYVNFQWMMIFALPFMLAYNGKKGRGLKNLFYAYYPLHIAALYIIGSFM
ncbi:MAG: TraX family protein, partial [Oscillospiraceae bacterium]